MKKKAYVSPEFRFQELYLFEGVAMRCWKFKEADVTIFYDMNRNDLQDNGEPTLFNHKFTATEENTSGDTQSGNGCANVTVNINTAFSDETIHQAFINAGYGYLYNSNVIDQILEHENAGDSTSVYIPVHS